MQPTTSGTYKRHTHQDPATLSGEPVDIGMPCNPQSDMSTRTESYLSLLGPGGGCQCAGWGAGKSQSVWAQQLHSTEPPLQSQPG
eukprot:scaffold115836_cov48-Prasinocladus_malaysianus.AAC.1